MKIKFAIKTRYFDWAHVEINCDLQIINSYLISSPTLPTYSSLPDDEKTLAMNIVAYLMISEDKHQWLYIKMKELTNDQIQY